MQGTLAESGGSNPESSTSHRLAKAFRATLTQALAFMHQHHCIAAFRFVQVCRAEQHTHTMLPDLPVDNGPQLTPRHRVDTHRRLVQ